jgi:hypothetical protein
MMIPVADLLRAIAALLWPIFAFCALYIFRAELRELLARVRKGKVLGNEFEFDAHGAARNAERKADAALASLGNLHQGELPSTVEATSAELSALAAEYDRVRSGPHPASGTSPIVSELVGRMIRAAANAGNFDVAAAAHSTSPGMRLAAYAYIYEHPAPAHLPTLVNALADGEPTGNGQYWAIQALAKVYARASAEERREVDPILRRVLANYAPSSDRGYALRRVLGANQGSTTGQRA